MGKNFLPAEFKKKKKNVKSLRNSTYVFQRYQDMQKQNVV